MEDKAVEAIKRHFDVVAESLRQDIKLVAEGHGILSGKVDDLRGEVGELREENTREHLTLNKRIDDLRGEVGELREENTREHLTLNKRIDDLKKSLEQCKRSPVRRNQDEGLDSIRGRGN